MANISKKNKKAFEKRAKELVSQMTIEEKIGQMVHQAEEIDRLNIKSYNWWNEALHGVARAGIATVFPQSIGLGATFNPELVEKIGDAISTEARAKYNIAKRVGDTGYYKGLTYWSPNVNIFRDPRWGRGHETYGEDPYLTSRMGVSFINGLQGCDEKYLKAAGCAKHYAVHSGPESVRHEFDAKVSKQDLYETYLPAFEACVKEAGVEGVMGAYNRTNGEVCCGSPTLLKGILRNDWGFDGYVTSDCEAIRYFHDYHKVTEGPMQSVALAVENTCDLNCGCCYKHGVNAVKTGLLKEELVDESLTRLFTTRMKLGEFDRKTPYDKIPYSKVGCKEHVELARESARESIVLLKNNGILPLSKRYKKVGVIGPNADSIVALHGNYHGFSQRYITVLEGLQDYLEKIGGRVYYSEGCHLYKDSAYWEKYDRNDEVMELCRECDVVIGVFGLDETLEGEAGCCDFNKDGDKAGLNFHGIQEEIMSMISKNAKKSILVNLTGSAMDLCVQDKEYDAIIQGWYPGERGGEAIAELIYGDYSPSGKLPLTFYRSIEDLPPFDCYDMKGRTYRYLEKEPLYPFGFGLSYTDFALSDLRVSDTKIGEKPLDVS
ncbi:MAG: glycoside hydrolase family 3 C-terminal domain-containing protein, partial [Clostridia bacterium]|nr:glycoside hydrolase family 3 C-terminal domain-containing protein [Clostridia bacterium]